MKRLLLCWGICVAAWVLTTAEAAGQFVTNYWTGTADGYWEEEFWSLGTRPSTNHDAVGFLNAGNKTLTIGRNTALNYPQALSIYHLGVDGPEGSTNRLLVDTGNLEVPLRVIWDTTVGPNGSLASIDSALALDKLMASAQCTIIGGTALIDRVLLGVAAPGHLTLTNTRLSSGPMILGPQNIFSPRTRHSSSVVQFGGTNGLDAYAQRSALYINGDSSYRLSDGVLITGSLSMQAYGDRTGLSRLIVSGGYADMGRILLGLPRTRAGEILFERGEFRASHIDTMGGTFTQTGGTNIAGDLRFPSVEGGQADYNLSGGMLVSSNLILGYNREGRGTFEHTGGVHRNRYMDLRGDGYNGGSIPLGRYEMSGGLLVCDTISFVGGRFAQSDGVSYLTNMVLWVNGSIQLSGGSFYSRTNPGVAVSQTGGLMVLSEGLQAREYLLYGGTLVAPDISVWPGLFLIAGTVRNTGSLALSEHSRLRIAHTQNLGVLTVGGRAALELEDGGTVRFAGANAWPGYGRLTVQHWSGSRTGGGENQVIFGSDASALTPSQLGQIVFENPAGFPAGTYPAKILASGEVVPDLPSIAFTRGSAGLSLSWSGSAMLYWSTNVGGPFVPVTPTATNLYDTFLADRQRFFILKQGASE